MKHNNKFRRLIHAVLVVSLYLSLGLTVSAHENETRMNNPANKAVYEEHSNVIKTADTITYKEEIQVALDKARQKAIEEAEAERKRLEEERKRQEAEKKKQEEIDLIAQITMAEAEGQSDYVKRLIISTILNRVDHEKYPDTVKGVIFQKHQFSPITNGRFNRCYPTDHNRQLVMEEMNNRTNDDVMYFRTGHYHKYGTPLVKAGPVYFSGV